MNQQPGNSDRDISINIHGVITRKTDFFEFIEGGSHDYFTTSRSTQRVEAGKRYARLFS